MREIKFRAWDREAKRFTNYQIGIFDDSVRFYDKAKGTWHNAGERFELMQYTGLKDKHQKPIYEGDIVNISSHTPFYNIVKFDEKGAAFQLCPLDKRWSKSYFTNYENVDKERFEIIGNIYENKELLNE